MASISPNKKECPVSRKFICILSILILGLLIGIGVSFGSAVALKKTSDIEFCSKCHTIAPMIKAYKMSVHGGKNKNGLTAKCTDCHVPHDTILNYLWVKTINVKELFIEVFTDTSKIDWRKKRELREDFVFDSGCLSCHKKLQESNTGNLKAFIAHKEYFMKTIKLKCVSCHKHVGHKDLGLYLKKQ